ncbi:MAG: HAD family hydrolase [Phycisphaerae bacterium]|nr:HAD family hydrolase [Phycisphaerae bacterium]
MKYKHIIWDWNGTLLNDVDACVEVVDGLMKQRKLGQLTIGRYKEDVDFPIIDFYTQLGFDFSKESYDALVHEYIETYLVKLGQCQLQVGAIETLEKLSKVGFSQSVLSAYNHQLLVDAVESFGLSHFFTDLVGLNDYYAHSKVDNGKKWIENSHFDRSEILFVGDMLHDFEVATEMGVDVVLLSCGHQSRGKLEATGAKVLTGMAELLVFLLK